MPEPVSENAITANWPVSPLGPAFSSSVVVLMEIVIRPPLQRVLVEIEDLLGGERDQVRGELRP